MSRSSHEPVYSASARKTSMTARAFVLALFLMLPLARAQGEDTPLRFAEALAHVPQSPAVVLAEGQVALAQARLEAASGLVSGSLAAEVSQNIAVDASSENATDIGPLTASARLNVIPYGDTADAVTSARYALERAQATLEDTRASTALSVVTQYLTALRATQEAAADGAVLEVAQQALTGRRAQQRSGAATEADVLSAQLDLSDAQNNLSTIILERDAALANLSQTLGVGVTAVAGEVPDVTLPELGNVETRVDARSDVQDARLSVAEAQLSADAAGRGVLPSGELSAGYGSSDVSVAASLGTDSYQPELSLSYDPDPVDPSDGNSVTLRASLTVPLASSTGAELSAAKGAVAAAEGQLEQVRKQAELEVQSSQNALTTAQSNLAASQALVAQQEASLKTSRERFRLGLVAAYDVEDAAAQLGVAQVNLARLQDAVLLAQLTLLQSLARDPLEVF